MSTEIIIDQRFNGPPRVVNGGYACATVAAVLRGPAQTTLLRPVPVATPLLLDSQDERATLSTIEGEVLAEAVPSGPLDDPAPASVSLDDANTAMARYPARNWGPRMFPCFVCGPERNDSLGVFPGPVQGRNIAAAVWRPDPTIIDPDGHVPDRMTWAVLDCTGSWAAIIDSRLQTGALLGRMTAQIVARPEADTTYITVGWAGTRDGRKLPAAAALFTLDGDLLAQARLLCIEPRPQRASHGDVRRQLSRRTQ